MSVQTPWALSSRPLAPVRYSFRLHDWKGAPWHVRRFKLTEALNAPYRLTLELVTDALAIDLDELLGDACELDLDRLAAARTIYGVVLAVEDLGRVAGRHAIRLEIGPALALLAQRVDTRAWQDRTAPEILREVLGGPLAEFGRSVRLDALDAGAYPRRDYCVQFQESDLAFARRLMEEEGISYFFDHSGPEVLVLVDDNRDFPTVQDGAPVSLVENEADTAASESIQHFVAGRRLVSTAVAQRNFDWQQPQAPLGAARTGADRRGRTREVYEHDDRVYPHDGERLARIKQERLGVPARLVGGRGNVTHFSAGSAFALQGHANGELDVQYIITRVEHEGECTEATILATTSSAPRYANTFEAIPRSVPYRPPLTHIKPIVSGLQTATVTGPPGEEVYCDEHGRIKVLPHWDRLSPPDDTASWWVRVAQPLAGNGWGLFSLPRVGMEVILDFVGGDPDRPVVLGCLHNGQNAPPYALPAEKTKITFKSNSSPGGGGSNELRFEDQAGAEEVYLHAQKDFNTVVEADMSVSVGASQTNTISANRTSSVGANDTTSVGANSTLSVGANLTESIGANHAMNVGATQSISAGATQSISAGASQSLSAGTSQSVSAGTSQSISAGAAQSISAGADQTVSVTGSRTVTVTGTDTQTTGARTITVKGAHSLTTTGADALTTGAAKTDTIGGAYTITIEGALSQSATAASSLSAPSYEISADSVSLVAGGTSIKIDKSSITISAGSTVNLSSCSEVNISSGTINISGGNINVTGGGTVAITGGTIQLNC